MLYFRSSVQKLGLDTSPLKFSISEKLHEDTRALCSETLNSHRHFVSILAPLLLWSCDFQLVKFFAFLQSAFVDGLMNAGEWLSCSPDLNPCHFRCESCWRINITAIILPLQTARQPAPDMHSYNYYCLVKENFFRDKWNISLKRWSVGTA